MHGWCHFVGDPQNEGGSFSKGQIAMKNIKSVVDHELVWTQQSMLKQEYDLLFGGEKVAVLRFPKMMGTLGVAESGDGTWTFERLGFWKSKTVVKANGSTEELGSYVSNTWKGGGVLELPTGKNFIVWRSAWKGLSEFRTEDGEALFQIHQRGAFRVSAALRINRIALQHPELAWLVLFGFYLTLMARRDTATQAAAG
jgi:hypothetical protein